jgi:hypothetical protein
MVGALHCSSRCKSHNTSRQETLVLIEFSTTQMLGLGLAGIYRRFLVYPAAMIWPVV